MRLEDYLNGMKKNNPEAVREIANELNALPFEGCTIIYLIPRIVGCLLNHEKLDQILQKLSDVTTESLRKKIFMGTTIPPACERQLKPYGLIYDGNIPSDIALILKKKWMSYYVQRFPRKLDPITPSAFLKLVLLLGMVQKEGTIRLNKGNRRSYESQLQKLNKRLYLDEEDAFIPYVIDYLKQINLIHWHKEKRIVPMTENIKKWFAENKTENIKQFYGWLKYRVYAPEILNLIKELGMNQEDQDVWINTDFFDKELLHSANVGSQLGLVRLIRYRQKTYIQLTPEGWFLAKEDIPPSWKSRDLLLSADFELFIPYNYDPFFIAEVHSFGELRSNEYFVVFDIDPMNKVHKGDFFDQIKNVCRYIPDVVRYDYENQ
jgi:hypothetical protein